jgi:chromosome segregation ATPase
MEDLENRVDDEIGSLETRVEDIEEIAEGFMDVGSGELEARVASLENEIGVISSVVSGGEQGEGPDLSALTEMSADLQALQETITEQTEAFAATSDLLDSLNTTVADIGIEIDSLTVARDELQEEIDDLEGEVAYLESLVEAIDARGSDSSSGGRGDGGSTGGGGTSGRGGGDSSSDSGGGGGSSSGGGGSGGR